MEITSVVFLLFVGISLLIYWNVPYRFQWIVLLIDSLFFYCMNGSFGTLVYICVSVCSVYFAGIYFEKEKRKQRKRLVLAFTIALNVGILSVLKYSNMFIGTYNMLFKQQVENINLLPSLAISYYTLQLVAYLVDTYLGVANIEKNPFKLLLFTVFFPQMVSGPISKWNDLGKQLFEEHRFDYERTTAGMRRIVWGIAKKVVVADRIAIIVNCMFDNVDIFSGIWIIISALVFVVQLYFDFSGCMDIVIGVSNCFGIKLAENFNAPFLSRSVQEIWQRWHITLGGWLRDYIMYPISRSKSFKKWSKSCKEKYGKRGAQIPYYVAMFVVWSLMGIWHGSSWKYMIGEGWYFGIIIVGSQILLPVFKKILKVLRINVESIAWRSFQVIRTTILFAIGNIAFRAESLSKTLYMYRRIFVESDMVEPLRILERNIKSAEFGGKFVLLAIVIVGTLQILCDVALYRNTSVQKYVTKQPFLVRWLLYYTITGIIILAGAFGKSQFIYFGF